MSNISHLFGTSNPTWTTCPTWQQGIVAGGCHWPQDEGQDETGVLNWPKQEEEDQRPGTSAGPGDQSRPDQDWVLAGPKTPGGQAEPKGGFGDNVWDQTTISKGGGFPIKMEWVMIAALIVLGVMIGRK